MITFTYEAILERLKENLKSKLGNSDMLFFSTNQRILEAIAEELSEQMRYDEYLMRESKWSTSQNLSSVLNQIDFFNYVPHRMIGCTGNLKVSASSTFNTTYPYRIIIPKFSQFGSSDLTFVSTEEVELLNNMSEVSVPIKQGEYRESVFDITYAYTEQDLISFNVTLDNANIDNDLYEVLVNGQLWRSVEHLGYSEGADDTVYEIKNLSDFSGITIYFGDGVISRRIEYGDSITIRWVETLGEDGELLQTNAITKVVSTFTDSLGNSVKLYCKNEEAITGGDSYESIESIKYNAPRALRLSSRLISKADYQNFILENSFADKVTVWGETETNIDNGDDMGNFIDYQHNLVFIAGVNFTSGRGIPLNEVQQRVIRDAFAPIKSLTDIVQFVDPQITYLSFDCRIGYRSDKYSPDQVRVAITNALMDTYAIDHADRRFKEPLYFSQYYELINALSEVEWHETSLMMIQYPEWVLSGTPAVPTYKFKIELNHKHIFHDLVAGVGEVELYIRNINAELPDDHHYKDWYKIATMSCSEPTPNEIIGYLVGEEIPVWSEGDDFSLPDAGADFTFVTPDSGAGPDRFNYTSGAYVPDSLDLNLDAVEILLSNGMCVDSESNISPSSDYELKIEFNGGTDTSIDSVLRTNVIPSKRFQLFACEQVGFSLLTPISAESTMGY